MANLDDFSSLKKLDASNIRDSIQKLSDQVRSAWDETQKLEIPEDYKNVQKLLFVGMGGSALGAHIILSLFSDQIKIPQVLVNDYKLPAWVDEKTLVIISSYSGNTEETVEAFNIACQKKSKILGITAGGELSKLFEKNNYPVYIFDPQFNPSGQPRMGLGYSILGQIGLLKNCGLISFKKEEDLQEIISEIEKANEKFGLDAKVNENQAKEIAQSVMGKIPIVIAADFLAGNGHVLANQINENAKTFAAYFLLPELNHHLLEGLPNPRENASDLVFLFLDSNLYPEKIQKRVEVTKEIIEKNGFGICEFKPKSESKLGQSFETLVFSSWLSFYLAMLNDIDPTPIPWVDYLKKKLK